MLALRRCGGHTVCCSWLQQLPLQQQHATLSSLTRAVGGLIDRGIMMKSMNAICSAASAATVMLPAEVVHARRMSCRAGSGLLCQPASSTSNYFQCHAATGIAHLQLQAPVASPWGAQTRCAHSWGDNLSVHPGCMYIALLAALPVTQTVISLNFSL